MDMDKVYIVLEVIGGLPQELQVFSKKEDAEKNFVLFVNDNYQQEFTNYKDANDYVNDLPKGEDDYDIYFYETKVE